MIYRDIINYTTIIMKNKSKNIFKRTKNIFNNFDNDLLESNSIINNSKKSINNEYQNSNRILSSNELSFLIFSSNKDTNKFKRDALFGNISIFSKEKDNIKFNSIVNNSNSFKHSNIYNYLENNIRNNKGSLINYLTSEKNKVKNDGNQLILDKSKNYNTTSKRDYGNLFDNQNDCSLNDYLNLYQNDVNIDNNSLNIDSPKENNQSPTKDNSKLIKNFSNENNDNIMTVSNGIINKNKNLETIKEEGKNENKNITLNEELFNTHIKEKISKIKNEIIVNNNLKQKKEEKRNIKNSKYKILKLKKDKNIDYYKMIAEILEQKDESKELERIFSEFFSEIKFKYWMKNSFKDFISSLNNCQIYDLIKLKKKNNNDNSNCFNELISNMELSNNKNLSNNNSYLYNSKSELLRDGSHSINDSQSSQTIENKIEKNIPFISKFPKLTMPQSIIPEESSNFLYSNNEILKGSLGEMDAENLRTNLMEVQEIEEEKNILYEENIKKELLEIENNKEINISNIFDNLNEMNAFNEEKEIDDKDLIKEYKSKIFYDILLIAQSNNLNITQEKPFAAIIKRAQ